MRFLRTSVCLCIDHSNELKEQSINDQTNAQTVCKSLPTLTVLFVWLRCDKEAVSVIVFMLFFRCSVCRVFDPGLILKEGLSSSWTAMYMRFIHTHKIVWDATKLNFSKVGGEKFLKIKAPLSK